MQIIGQEKLLNILNAYLENNSLPTSLLFVGEKGCGKHTIASYISSRLNIDIVDISEQITEEYLIDRYISANKNIYLLDFSSISIKKQNALLKFIEEPPVNSYIIAICEDKSQVITTIQNRCQILTFDKYSKQQLENFTDNEYLLSVCKTPGRIINFQALSNIDIEYYRQLIKTILEKIYNANIANILTISNKVAFKEEESKDKLPIDLFLLMLKEETVSRVIAGQDLSNQYVIIEKLFNDCLIPHINKKYLFENFLIRLKYSK